MNDIELMLRMTADVAGVDKAFDGVGTSAQQMARDVAAASDTASGAAGGFDRAASGAENLDDKAGRATGALGALSSGFELVGMEKYATGLQSAALATDFFSGLGQSATLILESQRLAQLKATVASARATVVTKAQGVATKAMTLAQRALNLAMRANPLGLVITAAVILGGLFVVLYKRSETFRNIVNKAGQVGRDALGWVVEKAKAVGRWIGDIPGRIGAFVDKLGWAKGLVKGYFEVMTAPARTLYNVIKDIVEWIGRIDIPDIPNLGGMLGRVGSGGGKAALAGARSGGSSGTRSGATHVVNITVNGAVDAASVAAQLRTMMADYYRALGWTDGRAVVL